MGRRPSFSAKTQIEDCFSLPISKFAKALQPGMMTSGGLTWSRGDREIGSIGWRALTEGVVLYYTVTPLGSAPVPLVYGVRIAYTRLVSGGRRPWWECPSAGCGRRCGMLYLP